ncbi:MAG: hypothetical protein AAGK32_13635, partial [Actinomycetota bacterium]
GVTAARPELCVGAVVVDDERLLMVAEQVRTGLAARVERDHAAWLQEVAETLADGRVARALNLSSRPPKAGAPLPRDLADRLTAAASAGLNAEVGQKRWQTVLESVARSPVRQNVVPEGIPSAPNDQLIEAVKNVSMQVPQIAAAFDIEPQRPKRRRRSGKGGGGKGRAEPSGDRAKAPEPAPTAAKAAPRIPPPPALDEPTGPRPDPAPAPAEAESAAPSSEEE